MGEGASNQSEPEERRFFEKHARNLVAATALAVAGGAYVANEHESGRVADVVESSQSAGKNVDWGTYLAPRESVPLEAFSAADEYAGRYGLNMEVPADPHESDKRDAEMKQIAKAHGISDIDMLQALRWKMRDAGTVKQIRGLVDDLGLQKLKDLPPDSFKGMDKGDIDTLFPGRS